MAYHTRSHYIPYLQKKLGGNIPVAMDNGEKGLWKNCKDAWLMYDPTADWHLVLQDDSIVCDDFIKRSKELLNQVGYQNYIISFYAGVRMKSHLDKAISNGHNKVAHFKITNENALCMRTKYIQRMVNYCDNRNAKTDKYIQSWARRNGIRILYPIPSLIDHRSDTSIYRTKYNKPNPDNIRHAVYYVDRYKDEKY